MTKHGAVDYHMLTDKELKDQELVTLHKRVLTEYIRTNLQWDSFQRGAVLAKYDREIDRNNIRYYYNRHVALFLIALIQDRLEDISNYKPDIIEYEDDEDYDEE